jgi:uncharacterized protein (TIGR02246 family)
MILQTDTSIHDQIAAHNEQFMGHFANGDAAALADLYTEEAQLLPPNSDFVTGKPAIQAFWQALFSMGISRAKLEIVEVEQCEETAIEISRYTMYGPGDEVLDQGKYIVVWKEVDGNWFLHRDIFNSSLPLPESG